VVYVLMSMYSSGNLNQWQHIPAGNLLLAAAILLNGQTFTSFAYLADVQNLVMFDLQREYVYPIVHTTKRRL